MAYTTGGLPGGHRIDLGLIHCYAISDPSIVIVDVSVPTAPRISGRIELESDFQGHAVDNTRGFFYTNLEDNDRTRRMDIATREVTATWGPECGDAGPRWLMLDPAGKPLMLARPGSHQERWPVCTFHRVNACRLLPVRKFRLKGMDRIHLVVAADRAAARVG